MSLYRIFCRPAARKALVIMLVSLSTFTSLRAQDPNPQAQQTTPAAQDPASGKQAPAQRDISDSLLVEQLQEVIVSAVRAAKDAPFAVSNIDRASLKSFSNTGKELPALFARTPGVLAWSENGVGTGTSYLRIRGAGGSRINVTLDGVPLNSPEDQTVFWANMNSYASLLGSVQIQRLRNHFVLEAPCTRLPRTAMSTAHPAPPAAIWAP